MARRLGRAGLGRRLGLSGLGMGRLGPRPRIWLGLGLGIVESLGLELVSFLGLAGLFVWCLGSVVRQPGIRLRLSLLSR